ncbi:THUMP domain-containing class I SAM-dependent RNA methyltransferase [Anaerococcus hydrogenalis]|uniref:THUMP domain-containing class I SAM-dependent RNA methyltransferase n=1 Tax=Anaerococcus hydrogenalis TaxID=33029 RepID=UPI001D341D20|nr:class I SAM-dependent RNA methyltransferase [Anaerococcus hydrogenalis]MBS5988640.1 class I SAM-dependent RNA methyltransferase [Anaerococcus hydrogenalis]
MEKIIISTSFGLESLIKRQLIEEGYEDFEVLNGKIILKGNLDDIGFLNLNLREADRVFLEIASFEAKTFEQLFENINKIDWFDYLNIDDNFIVNARSYKSKLFSIPSIQSISEKAIINSLKRKYKISTFKKSGSRLQIEVMLEKNIVSLCLDTSGDGLHKRGYREGSVKAPLRENLAAALVDLSFYKDDRFLFDGFCGSGTILIEAARKQRNIAPGLDRDFDFTSFKFYDKKRFEKIKKEAYQKIDYDKKINILGSDISKNAIKLAKNNALNAGVYEDITFLNKDFSQINLKDNFGIFISNPPYGERLSRFDKEKISKMIDDKFKNLNTWSMFIISSDEKIDKNIRRKVSKKRKLYNGGEKVDLYQYFGKKPKKDR